MALGSAGPGAGCRQAGAGRRPHGRPAAAAPVAAAAWRRSRSAAPAAPAAPTPQKGDTAWMFVATLLVIMMTIPGLALFYGGLVRSKNMLSVLLQVFMIFAVIIVLWCLYGYSLAFTGGRPPSSAASTAPS
jgi:Amt family ammonium transporter